MRGKGVRYMAEEVLTEEEMDALGELSNISMGSSTTALSALLQNKKVTIEMPRIEVINRSQALDDYERQCILVHINYSKGLEGGDILLLKPTDVMTMTDLMMGGDGTNNQGEVSDLQLSAISEAMNQMMGSAATSLSVMLNRAVDITPPETDTIDVESIKIFENIFKTPDKDMVKVTFRFRVGDLIDSTMIQLYRLNFAQNLIDIFMAQMKKNEEDIKKAQEREKAGN